MMIEVYLRCPDKLMGILIKSKFKNSSCSGLMNNNSAIFKLLIAIIVEVCRFMPDDQILFSDIAQMTRYYPGHLTIIKNYKTVFSGLGPVLSKLLRKFMTAHLFLL